MPTLTVGTNTYISLADAETYVSNRLGATTWDAATDANKEKALIMATKAVDRLNLYGVKKTTSQALQFPRCYPKLHSTYIKDVNSTPEINELWTCESSTPQAVLDAVVEESMKLVDDYASGSDANTRRQLQADGVKSFTLSKLSETYGNTGSSVSLRSREAQELLDTYIANSSFVR